MAVTESIGYAGDVDETDWARYAGLMGSKYNVAGAADLRPTISTTLARGVRIAAGVGIGCGVIDTATLTDVQLPVVASGSRWFLIVLKRVWGATKASQITFVDAPQSSEQLPARATQPGVEDDQPIALALVAADQTQVQQLRDLRVWSTAGGAVAVHTTALQYLTELGTSVTIDDTLYVRRLVGGAPAWFATDLTGKRGERPQLFIGKATSFAYGSIADWVSLARDQTTKAGDPDSAGMTAVGAGNQADPARIRFAQAGLYAFGYRLQVAAPAPFAAHSHVGIWSGPGFGPNSQVPICSLDHPGGNKTRYMSGSDTRWIREGTEVGLMLDVDGGINVQSWRYWATLIGN